jgi:hypothetical protein
MRLLLLTLALLVSTVTGFCQSARYTFTGQITNIVRDSTGSIAAKGWALGDPVWVSFDVDFGMPGRAVFNDGSVEVLPTYAWEDVRIDYFYARLVAGILLPEVNGGMYNGPEDVSEFLTGWNRSDWTSNRGVLKGGSGDSYFSLQRLNPLPSGGVADWRVQDWQVGTTVQGAIVGMSELDYSMIHAYLRLDSITLIPEPGVLSLLLVGGSVSFLCSRRRDNNRRD